MLDWDNARVFLAVARAGQFGAAARRLGLDPATASRRVAALEGGVSALCLATGQAALNYAFLTLADRGGSIVAPPQLYGTTHTLLAHTLRHNGIAARFARSRLDSARIPPSASAVMPAVGPSSTRQPSSA